MKTAVVSLLLVGALAFVAAESNWDLENVSTDSDLARLYGSFRERFPLTGLQASEHDQRFEVFKENVRYMKEKNSKTSSYKLGITQFADMTFEEFSDNFLSRNNHGDLPKPQEPPFAAQALRGDAETVDLSPHSGPIRNQGQCGSCWAFSSTTTLATQVSMLTGEKHESISVQSVVDCVKKGRDLEEKCAGESIERGWTFMKEEGARAESDYPYQCMRGIEDNACAKSQCSYEAKVIATVKDYIAVQGAEKMETVLKANTPMQFMMHVSRNFQHYTGGVFDSDDECSEDKPFNHGMTLIGYRTMDGTKVWHIQNSYGTTWGDEGYAYVARGNNLCHTEDVALFGDGVAKA